MALKCSKLYLLFNKKSVKSLLPVLEINIQQHLQISHSAIRYQHPKLNQAIEHYLEKAKKYDEFLKEQLAEYDKGKEFLKSMMGHKSECLTQEDVDRAIEYLFPSALFVPRARPLMKSPLEILQKQKEAGFDVTGRPFNFLFYTAKPKYNQCLHDAASMLEKLNSFKFNPDSPPKPVSLAGGRWLTAVELRNKFDENIIEFEYAKFIEVFNALKQHPFASEAEDFIKSYWKYSQKPEKSDFVQTVTCEGDVKTVKTERTRRKTSFATVSVTYPGTGKIKINNMGIDYFNYMNSRRQVSVGY